MVKPNWSTGIDIAVAAGGARGSWKLVGSVNCVGRKIILVGEGTDRESEAKVKGGKVGEGKSEERYNGDVRATEFCEFRPARKGAASEP